MKIVIFEVKELENYCDFDQRRKKHAEAVVFLREGRNYSPPCHTTPVDTKPYHTMGGPRPTSDGPDMAALSSGWLAKPQHP